MYFPGPVSNKPSFFQSFPVVIAEGHLAITIKTTTASPTTTLVIDWLRPAENSVQYQSLHVFILCIH